MAEGSRGILGCVDHLGSRLPLLVDNGERMKEYLGDMKTCGVLNILFWLLFVFRMR